MLSSEHTIRIKKNNHHFTVSLNQQLLAESHKTLTLFEADYPPVHYFPLEDINMQLLVSSSTSTRCPYKGEASYWSFRDGEQIIEDIVWSYQQPKNTVKQIKNYFAFYDSKVRIKDEQNHGTRSSQ